jgi:biopolymer transport protein TolR
MAGVNRDRARRRRPMSEINVVPYIDVMLVLLIIFMVTAPLLTQGVKVNLPEAPAEPIDNPEGVETLVVSLDIDGRYYVNLGEDMDRPVDAQTLLARVAGILRVNPSVPVAVKSDEDVPYGQVVRLMVLLQRAGAATVGLVTEPRGEPSG